MRAKAHYEASTLGLALEPDGGDRSRESGLRRSLHLVWRARRLGGAGVAAIPVADPGR